jgi:quinol monooxygenase YgiN
LFALVFLIDEGPCVSELRSGVVERQRAFRRAAGQIRCGVDPDSERQRHAEDEEAKGSLMWSHAAKTTERKSNLERRKAKGEKSVVGVRQTSGLLLDAFGWGVQHLRMNRLSNFVTLHPYFKVHPEKLEAFKAGFPAFVEKTASEEKNVFYEFTVNGDEVFCREGYTDAGGLLAHLENVGALLAEALKIADLIRLEVHGPAAELEKLREPLAHLNPAWFVIDRERT